MRYLPYLFFALFFANLTGWAATSSNALLADQQKLPEGSHLALLVEPLAMNGTVTTTPPLFNLNSNALSLPASTQKVITALASLLYLGADYRFSTTFSSPAPLVQHHLQGDLILNFAADPRLTHQDLAAMLQQLAAQGMQTIDGDLIINSRLFAGHDKAAGWPWNDLSQCFSAPPAATVIDRNCFPASLSTEHPVGQIARVYVPAQYPINISSQVLITNPLVKDNANKYCELDVTTTDNRYQLTGCLAKHKTPFPLYFAVQNPQQYAIAWLQRLLQQQGIQLQGKIRLATTTPSTGNVFARHDSAPLSSLLREMLKHSDNLIADTLFRTLGQRYYGVPGTWQAGADAVRDILLTRAHIDLANAVIVDGSGLSHHNLMSPAIMMQVLQYLAQHDKQWHVIDMLPVAGQDGTLQYRHSLLQAGMKGRIKAKTGTLQGVYNLAGYLTDNAGKQYAFVQYIANYTEPADQSGQRAIEQFESALYRDLARQ